MPHSYDYRPEGGLGPRAWTAAVLCLLAAAAGCGAPARPADGGAAPSSAAATVVEEGGQRPAVVPIVRPGRAGQEEDSAVAAGARREEEVRSRLEAVRGWGLEALPLSAPRPPQARPELTPVQGVSLHEGLPPVVARVPTDDQVVFLTVDDGVEKDPQFARMAGALGIPFSAFLADRMARSDYAYFRELAAQGHAVHNHTLTHPDLKLLGYEQQRQEICGQQDQLERELGTRPRLFRPPYGEYDDTTLRAAGSCGIEAVPLWNEEAFPDHMEYRYADQRLHPGDIILTHFRGTDLWNGTMPQMLREVLDTVTAQGFALARLEDYL